MPISTGTQLALPELDNGSYNTLFDSSSSSIISHIITVDSSPFIVEAYNLTGDEVVEVWSVGGIGAGQFFDPVYIKGFQVKLTSTDNKLSIDASGRYQFRLTNGGLGTVHVIGHDANIASNLVGLGKYVI